MKATGTLSITVLILAACAAANAQGGDTINLIRLETIKSCAGEKVVLIAYGRNDKPLDDADVDVIAKSSLAGSKKIAYGKTNDSGKFEFVPDKEGSYDITVKKEDYMDLKTRLNVDPCATTTSSTSTTSSTTIRRASSTTTSTTRRQAVTTTTLPRPTTTTTRAQESCNPNGFCEINENYANCPRDCSGAKDGYCDRQSDGKCDPDCQKGDPDCGRIDVGAVLFPIAVIMTVFGITAAYGMKRELKKKKAEDARTELVERLKERLRSGEDPQAMKKELLTRGQDVSLLEKAEKGLWS